MAPSIRKPISNFIIKREIQSRIIFSIVIAMIVTGVLTSVLLALYYNSKSAQGTFYFMSNNVRQDLELASFLGVILPALIVAQMVSFVIAIAVALFSSRQVAVPIFKMEKWAERLAEGDLRTKLSFRERDKFHDLSMQCNKVNDYYLAIFSQIKDSADSLNALGQLPNEAKLSIEQIHAALGRVKLPS
jgi:methyl-accepting chemotaxis protein